MRKIKDFNYFITDQGDVFNAKGKKLKGQVNIDGYHTFNLWIDGKSYTKRRGRMVAEAYVPNPNNYPVVDHIDGDRLNDSKENLEWVTTLENNLRSIGKFPERHKNNTKLSYEIVHEICRMLEGEYQNKELSEHFGVGIDVIKKIRNGVSWTEVSCDYKIRHKAPKGKYSEEQIIEVCELVNQGYSNKEIETMTDGKLTTSLVKSVKSGKSYKRISCKYLKV